MAVCMIVFVVLTLSSLAMPDVLGYEMADIIRALHEREIANAAQPITDPSELLVDLFLEAFDTDNDDKFTLPEVRSFIGNVFQKFGVPPKYGVQITAFFMTVATISDSDADGFIERNEIRRFASTLVREYGVGLVGKCIAISLDLKYNLVGDFPAIDANMIFRGLDQNHDGVLSAAEREVLYVSRGVAEDVVSTADAADSNGDGNLSRPEASSWVAAVHTSSPSLARHLYIYGQIVSLAGEDEADAWARYSVHPQSSQWSIGGSGQSRR